MTRPLTRRACSLAPGTVPWRANVHEPNEVVDHHHA
jgi:hypothetical protein